MKNYLNFETDIKNLESEIEKLKDPYNQDGLSEVDTQKISSTQAELDEKLKDIYSNLDPWQTTMVARHEDRPESKFFIDNLFEDFISLSVFRSIEFQLLPRRSFEPRKPVNDGCNKVLTMTISGMMGDPRSYCGNINFLPAFMQ